jgi:hypothetical protein
MNVPNPTPFVPEWPAMDRSFLDVETPPAPPAPITEVFGPHWGQWMYDAAEAKGAPVDYVLAASISVCGSLIGNTRWPSPWSGWSEPPVLWAMSIGTPSMGKSPGMDAVLGPLGKASRQLRQSAEGELSDWRAKEEIATLAEQTWKEATKAALKLDEDIPAKPDAANPGPRPCVPRLSLNDATVEKIAVTVAEQPRGTLMVRDELSGWLGGMTRYSGGGSDRPFWLEAYGGRGYNVERMGRESVYIDRLTVGVVGGIQPDKLSSLLFKTDDDGLLARFIPIWPDPAPLRRPTSAIDEGFLEDVIAKLLTLQPVTEDDGETRPWIVPFTEDARDLLDEFRIAARSWEANTEGLLLSFIGKLQGMALRLSAVIAFMDWAVGGPDVMEITHEHFGRASHLIEAYILPMAKRAYAADAMPKEEKAARRLAAIIREQRWERFTSRGLLRLCKIGLRTKVEVDPALKALEEADIIRHVQPAVVQGAGRPKRIYITNPEVWRQS